MITIIHGEDIASSRKFYIEERNKTQNPMIFYGETLSPFNLSQAMESNSLFKIAAVDVFIENFFSKKSEKGFETIVSILKKNNKNANITIYETKELTKKQLGFFEKSQIKLFALPKALFAFLNEIKPKNGKNAIILFHKTLETTERELVFFMITRQFRLLLASLDTSENCIDEIKRMSPWQKSKLEKQSLMFSKPSLKKIYQKIYNIDASHKSGISLLSLTQAIDFLLLSI